MEIDEDVTGIPTAVGPARLLQDLMDRLLVDYSSTIAAGSIVRCVARCTRVASGVGLEDPEDFVWFVENLSRRRLDARLGLDEVVPTPTVRGSRRTGTGEVLVLTRPARSLTP